MSKKTSSTTVEQKSKVAKSKLQGATLNGEAFDIEMNLTFKADVKQAVVTKTTETVANLVNSFVSVSKGYYTMLPDIAVIIGNELYKTIVGIKSPQQLLIDIVGTSKETASEMCKVAKRFYNADGTLKEDVLGLFTYSELVKLKNETDDVIENVIDKIKSVEKHTRADVIQAIKDAKLKAIGVDTDEKKEETTETTDESTNNESTENKSENFKKVDSDETPFKTDWQAEYINIANSMTDIVDDYKKELDNPDVDYKELARIAYETMNSIIAKMLENISK